MRTGLPSELLLHAKRLPSQISYGIWLWYASGNTYTDAQTGREKSHSARRGIKIHSTNRKSHIQTHAHGERRNCLIPKHVNSSDIHSHSMFMHRARFTCGILDPWHNFMHSPHTCVIVKCSVAAFWRFLHIFSFFVLFNQNNSCQFRSNGAF